MSDCGVKSPPSLPPVRPSTRRRELIMPSRGVLFEGYNIPCDEDQARIFLETAKRYCPEIVRDIEEAVRLARRD
jgi:hypothetical protein